jgi:hypothetical protein
VAVSFATSQADSRNYLLRISHHTFDDYSCALLQSNGAFHLEFQRGDDIHVFEGATSHENVLRIQVILDRPELRSLSQQQIEEPIVRGRTEKLQLTIYRHDHWQDLFFQSVESEEPVEESVNELVRWLDDLHRLPHKEFSEDEGKQNCLPPGKIALTKRDPNPLPAPAVNRNNGGLKSALKVPPLTPTVSTATAAMTPLLRVYSVAVKSGDARRFCSLIADTGRYRFEDSHQKTGKPLKTETSAGMLTPQEVAELRMILDSPAMATIRHHEPRGSAEVPMMGDMMNLYIARPTGDQDIILSSSFGRQFGSFYGGDADVTVARDLTKFLKDHIENNKTGTLEKSDRNDCTEIP